MLLWLAIIVSGCKSDDGSPEEEPSEPSPNVTIAPAPLLSGESLVAKPDKLKDPNGSGGSGRPEGIPDPVQPQPWALNQPPPPDRSSAQVGAGVTLQAHFEWPGKEKRLRFHDLAAAEAEALNASLQLRLNVELRPHGRMRIEIDGGAFSLAPGSKLLARQDAWGHLLVWPDSSQYRVLGSGALRALFAEGRADISPLSRGEVERLPEGKLLGQSTERQRLTTPRGSLVLDQARLEATYLGGPLLCRFLLELVSMQSTTDTCSSNLVPLRAELRGEGGAELLFVADSFVRRNDGYLPLRVPPSKPKFKTSGLPQNRGTFLTKSALAALDPQTQTADLELVSRASSGAYVTLNGTRLAFIEPRARLRLEGLPEAQFKLGLRTFFGRELVEEKLTKVPNKLRWGGPKDADAGAP